MPSHWIVGRALERVQGVETAAPPVVALAGSNAARTAGLRLAIVGVVLIALTAAGPWLHRSVGDLAFNALGVTQGLLALLAVRLADRSDQRVVLWTILVGAVVMRLCLLFVHPHLSSDMFRYVWDGRVQGAGINPYRYIPNAPELAFLRDTAIWPFINRADYAVTIYPPAAQMLFALVVVVVDGMIAMKLAFLAFEAVAVGMLLDLLRRIGQPASRIVAYAWHPLAVYEIAGSAHVDAPMMAVALLGIWLAVVRRHLVLAAFAIALAAMMKPLAALALPVAWRPWTWLAPLVAAGTVLLLYLPYVSVGFGAFAFVPGYLQEEKIAGGEGFWPVWLLVTAFGPQPWARTAYLVAAFVLLLWLALRVSFAWNADAETRLRRLSWLVFAGILAASPNYAWYWLFLVPFVALFGSPPFWAATIGCFLLYDEVWADLHVETWIRDGALHLGILAALAWMAWARRSARRQPTDASETEEARRWPQ